MSPGPEPRLTAAATAADAAAMPDEEREPLDRLARVATEAGAPELRARIDAFRRRIAEGRFYLACIGEFKRGKSTLLNALLDRSVLPMGLVPVTTVPTIVQYGAEPSVRVEFIHGDPEMASVSELDVYVSEVKNPRNVRGVETVRVSVPSPLLENGLCLVDTPGLGSVFGEGAAATRAFLPQIDAALVVLGADPPISGEEAALVKAASKQVRHVIVVLNKADRFNDAERAEAIRYTGDVLSSEIGQPFGRILEVSAAERLARIGPARDWDVLVQALTTLSSQSGRALVRSALERGTGRLARASLREVNEAHGALFRPWEESDRRVAAIRSHVGRIAFDDLTLGFRMRREEEAMLLAASERRKEFLARALPAANAELTDELARAGRLDRGVVRVNAFRAARVIAERCLAPWIEEERRAAEDWYRARTDELVAVARTLLASLGESGELGVGDLSGELEPSDHYRIESQLEIERLAASEAPPAGRAQWWRDRIGPRGWMRRALAKDASEYLGLVLASGARMVEDDLHRRVDQSDARLKQEVQGILNTVYESADRAAARALAVRTQGNDSMHRELRRLEGLRQELAAIAMVAPGHDRTGP